MKIKSLLKNLGCSLVVVYAVAVSTGIVCAQDEDAGKNEAIYRLLEVTKSGENGVQAMNMMIDSFRYRLPEVPEDFWADFLNEASPKIFNEMSAPIYAKHFTTEEVNDLIKFYESPIGVKFISVMPAIMEESHEVGSQWGETMAEKIMLKLEEQGLLNVQDEFGDDLLMDEGVSDSMMDENEQPVTDDLNDAE